MKNQKGDDCIENFHLGRYLVVYTVRSNIFPLLTSRCKTKLLAGTLNNNMGE